MNTNRKTAIIVGVLYIVGTVAGILSVVFTQSTLDDPDYLTKVSGNGTPIATGALFVLIMGLALALVPVMMFPILKKHNEALAVGYVVYRGALETLTYLGTVISWLLLVGLSRAYAQAGAPAASSFQPLGALLVNAGAISANLTEIVFPIGALMFYTVLFQSNLIPRWISGWGLIAGILFVAAGLLHMFGVIGETSTILNVLVLPMALQEMALAVWLIVKGFNPPAAALAPAKIATNAA